MPPPEVEFSAVIPTHDRAALVARAIESALAQRPAPAEVIVVDDGSTDGTAEVLAGFGQRIRVLHQANAGCSAARNAGVRAARSPWIAFLDSDDVWEPGHLERLAAAIRATGGRARFYFADARLPASSGSGSMFEQCDLRLSGPHRLLEPADEAVAAPRHPMFLQGCAFHRKSYLEVGGLWELLPTREDTHLFLKLGLGAPACAVAGIGVCLSDDAPAGQRLTSALPAEGRAYREATVRLYRDVLARRPSIDRALRAELRRRLARGRWVLATLELRSGRPLWASALVAAGLWTWPGLALEKARGSLGRLFS